MEDGKVKVRVVVERIPRQPREERENAVAGNWQGTKAKFNQ